MKILFSADPEISVPPKTYGGVQRLVDGLIREYQVRGHTIGLVARAGSSAEVDAFFPFPGGRSQSIKDSFCNTLTMKQACSSFKPDVLHSFSRLLYLLPVLRSSFPKVMTYGRYPGRRQVHIAQTLADRSLAFAGCSNHIVRTGQSGGGLWKTVYNFVEIEKLIYQSSVPDNAPLVFLSRIERIKGTHTAIKIAQQSSTPLIIAGNRPELKDARQYWEDEICKHIDGKLIQYIGPVDDVQKNELLGQAKALIVPIEWDEPFGMVFTEALACGTPVISTDRGAVPEIIRDGQEGYIIRSLEEGIKAVENLHKIDRDKCRKRVEQLFTREIVADQYLKFYDKIRQRL